MEKLKLTLLAVISLSFIGLLGYWSFTTIQSGSEHALEQKIKKLEKENEDLKIELEKQKNGLDATESKATESTTEVNQEPEVTIYQYQSLMNELQKLASGNVFLKLKSRGPSVGTVQKFLNIYNDTSNKVDNDYGASTKTAVAAFQKAEGLTADGEAGPGTFNKMIDWLKEQG